MIDKSVKLVLKRNGDKFIYELNDIKEISSSGDKVWFVTKRENKRIYLIFDEEKFKNLPNDFRSPYLLTAEDISVYEQYKDVDQLRYHVEKHLFDLKNQNAEISTKDFIDKTGVKTTLINIISKGIYNDEGEILSFTSKGRQGYFDYCIGENYLFIHDMAPNKNSVGLGSAAIEMMVEIANERGLKKIVGKLAYDDLKDPEHKSRLFHFYKKNGFEIYEDKMNIVKIL